jgi:hypothetical protein
MDTVLLALRLGRKRDVIEARQRARQVAGLLGFDSRDQACIAAGVFALACQAYRQKAHLTLFFRLRNGVLHVFFGKRNGGASNLPGIEKRLPEKTFFAEADIKWMVGQVVRRPAPSLFEEMEKLNQDLLEALVESGRDRGRSPVPHVTRNRTA